MSKSVWNSTYLSSKSIHQRDQLNLQWHPESGKAIGITQWWQTIRQRVYFGQLTVMSLGGLMKLASGAG